MSETAWRWLIWAATTVIAYFVIDALTTWATAIVVIAAIIVGLICSFLDVILMAIFSLLDGW